MKASHYLSSPTSRTSDPEYEGDPEGRTAACSSLLVAPTPYPQPSYGSNAGLTRLGAFFLGPVGTRIAAHSPHWLGKVPTWLFGYRLGAAGPLCIRGGAKKALGGEP